MILVVTNRQDPHADHVIRALKERGNTVFRLNTDDFLAKYRSTIRISEEGLSGSLVDEIARELDLATCSVGWIRRPEFALTTIENLTGEMVAYIRDEYRAFIATLYALPNVSFVNDHFHADRAKHKIPQLILAMELGMRVPDTIITNDPNEALNFVARQAWSSVLTKPIYTSNYVKDGVPQGISSAKLSSADLRDNAELIRHVPTKLQEYVEKAFELRVVVVGDRVFAVRIDSQENELTKVDWRAGTGLCPHYVFEPDERLIKFCLEFCRRQKLLYGAFDFIVTPEGDFVFLENNPAGQFLWLEQAVGVPITAAFCELFEKFDRH